MKTAQLTPLEFLPSNVMNENINSVPLQLRTALNFCIQAAWTGTPTGTLSIKISNNGVNFDPYTGSAQALAGSDGSFSWNIYNAGFQFVMLAYTFTSGTGSIAATFNVKGN